MSFAPAPPHPSAPPRRKRRRGPVLALLAAVLVLHGLLLSGLGGERLPSPRPGPLPAAVVVWTRSVPLPEPVPAGREPSPPVPAEPLATEAAAAATPPRQPMPAVSADAVPKTPASVPAARETTPAVSSLGVPPAPAPVLAAREAPAAPAAAADADADEPDSATGGGSAPPLYATRLPGPAQLRFQLHRGQQRGQALLQWQPSEDDRYAISFEATAGGRPLIEQRGTGRSGPQGLAPERFQDKRRGRAAQQATFDTDAQRIAFSGRAPDLPLWAGAQDRLGWIVQLAGIVAAAAQPPQEVRLYVVGARGGAGPWTFVARGIDEVATPLGPVQAFHYERAPAVLRDQRVEAWLDPARGYWPVKLRFTPVLGGAPLELLLEEEPRRP
jgi:hypothetical protein